MQDILGSVLPKFSRKEVEDLKIGVDFIGINHYTGSYVKDCMYSSCGPMASKTTGYFMSSFFKDGIPIGEPVSRVT
jgi:beta-glucosidase